LLAALTIGVGHDLSQGYLVEAIWGPSPPSHATAALQTHVSRLRHVLGADAIIAEDHSYRLVARCRQIDACRFQRSIRKAAAVLHVDPATARDEVHEAMRLWRGVPFGDLAEEEFCFLEMRRLGEVRCRAEEIELEASLALGRYDETVSRLQAAVADEPYRERRWYLLIYALAQAGRRVEALRAHHDLTATLTEVGLTPTHSFDELAGNVASGEPLPPLAAG
jgi:DNA-binding SARP family transcriptional activator